MTDKELLRLAAKAAGIEQGGWEHEWNPLTDDGEALRLAVKLGMMIDDVNKKFPSRSMVAVSDAGSFYEPHGTDPYAATRRAIVRAAANVGLRS